MVRRGGRDGISGWLRKVAWTLWQHKKSLKRVETFCALAFYCFKKGKKLHTHSNNDREEEGRFHLLVLVVIRVECVRRPCSLLFFSLFKIGKKRKIKSGKLFSSSNLLLVFEDSKEQRQRKERGGLVGDGEGPWLNGEEVRMGQHGKG